MLAPMSTRPLLVPVPLADLAKLVTIAARTDALQADALDLAKRDFAGSKPERAVLIVTKVYRLATGSDPSEANIVSILRELCDL